MWIQCYKVHCKKKLISYCKGFKPKFDIVVIKLSRILVIVIKEFVLFCTINSIEQFDNLLNTLIYLLKPEAFLHN